MVESVDLQSFVQDDDEMESAAAWKDLDDLLISFTSTPTGTDDESSKASSLLSDRSDEDSSSSSSWSDNDGPDHFSKCELEVLWRRLEREFSYRNKLLKTMRQGLPRWHWDAIICNEIEARSIERRQLLMDFLREGGRYDAGDSFLPATTTKTSRWDSICNVIAFERRSSLPAIGSMLLFNTAYSSVFELINTTTDEVQKYLAIDDDALLSLSSIHVCLFAAGVLMLRAGGDLYWFLNSSDYDSTKFDFHNRAKLGHWDTNMMRFVRNHQIFRAILYILGYSLCYESAYNLQQILISVLFDESDSILEELPSEETGYIVSVPESADHWLEHGGDGHLCRLNDTLIEDDIAYTYAILAPESYMAFWESSFDILVGDDLDRYLISARTATLVNFAVMMAAFLGLIQYGFSWWLKY